MPKIPVPPFAALLNIKHMNQLKKAAEILIKNSKGSIPDIEPNPTFRKRHLDHIKTRGPIDFGRS